MMMPISLIENKNTNVYIMQDLDLKYLHKKKPCINPFRWWQSRAGCHRGQRVPASSLLRSPSEPCIKILFSKSLISVYTVLSKDDKDSSHSKTGHGRGVRRRAGKRVESSSVRQRRHRSPGSGLFHWLFLALACVRMWDFRLVDCANFLLQPSKGHTYGRSPVWMRTCVRKLKSSEKRLPQPSNVHWKMRGAG